MITLICGLGKWLVLPDMTANEKDLPKLSQTLTHGYATA
jgi:hypothetical protein